MGSDLKPATQESVTIMPEGLQALLAIPEDACGIVIFAHGSGSGRLSPRNNRVAAGLRQAGLATLLLDLLTPDEEGNRANVFDIPLLARRLRRAAQWVNSQPELAELKIGYFGASTGAGAALLAAANPEPPIAAIVSRGGRPDLAGSAALSLVKAPTLLIVGGLDTQVIELNRQAMGFMNGTREMVIVPGAGHLFEEGDSLDKVVDFAAAWFTTKFC